MTGQEADADPLHFIEESSPIVAAPVIASLDEHDANRVLCEWDDYWRLRAHPGQIPPEGAWLVWLVMGGRGFGKTRAGAEWVRAIAEADPFARIALVGASLGEVRSVMVEGDSGIIACCPPHARPLFEPSLHRLRWPGGAQAFCYSAAEPEALRGPQHSHASGAGSKGVFRQPVPLHRRSAAAPRDQMRTGNTVHGSSRGSSMDSRPQCDWRMGRTGEQDRRLAGRHLDLCRPDRWNVGL